MAEAVVNLLIEHLGPLLLEEAKSLKGVRREVKDIKIELERMLAFLRDADERSENEEGVKAWVKQVRDLAYETEDVLDEFFFRLSQTRRAGFFNFLLQCTCFLKGLKARHKIASRTHDIKTKVHHVSEMRGRYQLNSLDQAASSSYRRQTWHDPRGNSLLLEESEVVGLSEPKQRLIEWLFETRTRVSVISVFGAGGLGKTTLVKKVYDEERVKDWFQCHAWITVSQNFRIDELLRRIILQFSEEKTPDDAIIQNKLPSKVVESMEEDKLKETLKDYLQKKRYLIVFDDIWSIDAWVAIRYALPDSECGSRVMLTTRSSDIAQYCIESYGYAYEPNALSWGDAWTLFCRKAFKSELQNSCPKELFDLSQKILKRCEGLPLAVVAIAGLLSTKEKTLVEWGKAYRSLGSQLERNPFLNDLKMILSLSYNDLPYRLKSCFLVFGAFPEDYTVKRTRLIRLWIAERFVQREDEMNEEEVGEGYLDELIKRSLIQVIERDCDGRVRSCRVHDILRDFILLKAREQNFFTICTEGNMGLQAADNIRRLSIHNNCNNVLQSVDHSHLRSLFLFGKESQLSTSGFITSKKKRLNSSAFKLLKVLDFDHMPMKMKSFFPTQLLFLRYLRLRSSTTTNIKKLPKSIGLLKNLETLDLKGTGVCELPQEILKLQNLRNLLMGYSVIEKYEFVSLRFTQGVRVPVGIRSLVGLQKLSYVDAKLDRGNVVGELAMLTNIRRLGIVNLRIEDGKDFCSSVEKMKHLESLFVTSVNVHKPKLWDMDLVDLHSIWTPLPLLDLQAVSSPPQLLQRLYLHGRLEKLPDWISSLGQLVRIHLMGSKLIDDSYKGLGALPNLVTLKLTDAYDGEFLCFEAGGFRRLQSLHLHRMGQLKTVVVEKGAMPCLTEFETMFCMQLFLPIPGIEHLHQLNKFHFNSII